MRSSSNTLRTHLEGRFELVGRSETVVDDFLGSLLHHLMRERVHLLFHGGELYDLVGTPNRVTSQRSVQNVHGS